MDYNTVIKSLAYRHSFLVSVCVWYIYKRENVLGWIQRERERDYIIEYFINQHTHTFTNLTCLGLT